MSASTGSFATAAGLESGDRASFMARLAGGLSEPAHENLAHPRPPMRSGVPEVVSAALDPHDLVGTFCRQAEALACTVHRVSPAEVAGVMAGIVARHGVRRAVVTSDPRAGVAVTALREAGVDVTAMSKQASSVADLGLTVADGAIATTGTVVQYSDRVGGRTASLLPPVFCCVVPVELIGASLADAMRAMPIGAMPSNVVLITGPSRSGDIENTLVRGVHGPITVELLVVAPEPD